jgi:hypothetical protein
LDETSERIQALRHLLHTQLLGVLSTHAREGPHASLVAFAASGDLREILFATPRTTRKFDQLASDARGVLLVDNRTNTPADFHRAVAAAARGTVKEVPHEEKEVHLGPYLARHPHLSDFVRAPTCALMRLRVEGYGLVQRFQEVTEIRVDGLATPCSSAAGNGVPW